MSQIFLDMDCESRVTRHNTRFKVDDFSFWAMKWFLHFNGFSPMLLINFLFYDLKK